jgi:hypothetical protein
MRLWHKFVSTGVLTAIVMLPFLSMAMCVPEDAGSMQCPPDCPMMAKMKVAPDGMDVKSSEAAGACCQFKSAKPAPVTESKTVSPVVSVEPLVTSTPLVETSNVRPIAVIEASPPAVIDSQAQLCTFLI